MRLSIPILVLSCSVPWAVAQPSLPTLEKRGAATQLIVDGQVDIMNAHWIDYDRLFTVPNP